MFKPKRQSTKGFTPHNPQDKTNIADIPNIDSLPEKLAMQLHPFWIAYHRPYPPAVTWRQMKAEGYEPIEHTTCGISEIEESFDELIQWTLDDDGFVVPIDGNPERATWQDRLINKWTRKKIWKLEPRD